MVEKQSIDVVIPSFRLDEAILMPIFKLKQPEDVEINFYLIADNPVADIPLPIRQLADMGKIRLIINEVNLGFSLTRNKGINEGTGQWILLLDDDIIPDANLLIAYAKSLKQYPQSIGFVGVTHFPEPQNDVTRALVLNGSVGHFQSALHHAELMWAPTANMMFNRQLLQDRRFMVDLRKGGEDIELLLRNSLANSQKYKSVPEAVVTHPWWDNGAIQTRRMFRYGEGAGEISVLDTIKPYTYRDFTNTSETLLIILFLTIITSMMGFNPTVFYEIAGLLIFTEFFINLIRSVFLSNNFSLSLAFQMMWHKNAYEAGYLWSSIRGGRFSTFGKRIDTGFKKVNPSPFRLNKWKIIKLLAMIAGITYLIFAFQAV